MAMPERIVVDPNILVGKPVVKGTRLAYASYRPPFCRNKGRPEIDEPSES